MGSRPVHRMPAAISCPVAFGGYLVVAAGLTMVRPGRLPGLLALLVIAALVGWWTTVPGAVGTGLLGWPCYAGFVTHADGVIGVTGRQDVVVAGVLLAGALSAVAVRAGFARLSRLTLRHKVRYFVTQSSWAEACGVGAMSTTTAPANPVSGNGIATRRDLAVNGLVLGFAGAMWLGWAQQRPPAGWPVPLTIASGLGLLVAVLAGVLAWHARRGASAMADPRGRRTYFRVVGIEAAAILAGAAGLGISGQVAQLAPWVLFVVGVHFVPLGRLFGIRSLAVAGGLLVAVSVVAVIVGAVSMVAPSAVTGGAGGPILIGFGAWSLLRHRRAAR